MQDQYLSRQKGALWFQHTLGKTAIIIGAGGIGSFLSLSLCRLGLDIIIYDNDTFESHNMTGQFVGKSLIGVSKVEAVCKLMKDFNPDSFVETYQKMYEGEGDAVGPIMLVGPDNMEARKISFEHWVNNLDPMEKDQIFIDGRIGWDVFEIYCVTPDKIEEYRASLFEDSEIPDMECTLKQTTYITQMCSAMMANYLKNFLGNEGLVTMNTVPFFTKFDLQLIKFELNG